MIECSWSMKRAREFRFKMFRGPLTKICIWHERVEKVIVIFGDGPKGEPKKINRKNNANEVKGFGGHNVFISGSNVCVCPSNTFRYFTKPRVKLGIAPRTTPTIFDYVGRLTKTANYVADFIIEIVRFLCP